ncbi:hypothetical protein RDV78_07460 [Bacillota bacterium LX-D]|nr:hypothetical protein [Bacillota bacterium LX-D]
MNFNEDLLALLQSAQPFLGGTGQRIVDLTNNLYELFNSSPAQNALQTLSAIKSTTRANALSLGDSLRGENRHHHNLLALFMLVILLFLSENPLKRITKGFSVEQLEKEDDEQFAEVEKEEEEDNKAEDYEEFTEHNDF